MTKEMGCNVLLKDEIKALCVYVNREVYNLNVVEVMVSEIAKMVKGEIEYNESIIKDKKRGKIDD